MALSFKVQSKGLAELRSALTGLLERTQHLKEFNQEAATYMVRSTRNRILRSKRSPDGTPFAPLADLTVDVKGHSSILFETGNLARSVHVDHVDDHGFTISADADYARLTQDGRRRTRGRYDSNRSVPARPFIGISDANVQRISKMLRSYIAGLNDYPNEDFE
jgi:phage virion morphogenesis protein